MNKNNLENVIRNLSRYASGDNSQPFFFKIDDSLLTIKVFHDYDIAFHDLNPENLVSLISLGMIIQMMEELSLVYSFKFSFQLEINEAQIGLKGRNHWGTFTIDSFPKNISDENIFTSVRTNRMPYSDKDISISLAEESVKISSKLNSEELSLLLNAESKIWDNSSTIIQVFRWAHITKSSYLAKRTGFHFKELNMNIFESLLIPFFKINFFAKVASVLPIIKILTKIKSKSILKRTPNFVGIYCRMSGPLDLIELGKKAYKAKYQLGKKGIVSQPLSPATFPYIYKRLLPNIKVEVDLYLRIQNVFKNKFNHNPDGNDILWIFRAGFPIGEAQLSLRKNLSEIIQN